MILSYAYIICTLVMLEVLLSADNAIVLAALAQGLPKHQQKKALFYGLLGAFVLRFLAILCAKWIIHFWFLQVIGGAYLIWLGIQHITESSSSKDQGSSAVALKAKSFWGVIVAIELTDLAFAVDSVLAAVALSSNIWVIYTGAMIGLIAMRFAATMVLKLLEKFPALIIYAYVIVMWIGVKLAWQGMGHGMPDRLTLHEIPESVFWITMLMIVCTATLHGLRASKQKN